MSKALVNKKYQLKKFPGKGGWIYTAIDEILQDKKAKFGWVKVKGRIDNYEIKNYRLMPLKNGKLFLPVKAEIRKIIGKSEGDWINVVLYADNDATEIPDELLVCLLDEPIAHKNFMAFSDGQQKAFVDWIMQAKRMETKATRIAVTVEKALRNEKFNTTW